ncbi:unnamed protein product [Linum trigynum]|uniref:Uncharacterized protein n=1 Tax=Linum trigynum TaxID=586398 RepID=A0AAV2ERL9_9ROSI
MEMKRQPTETSEGGRTEKKERSDSPAGSCFLPQSLAVEHSPKLIPCSGIGMESPTVSSTLLIDLLRRAPLWE